VAIVSGNNCGRTSCQQSPESEGSLSFVDTAVAFLIALAAGAFGSVLGIGGGLFIIPSLNLFLGINLKTAIAASIVAVIATSLSGGNVYVRNHVADIRLGLVLALATVPGAIVGAKIATVVNARVLAGIYALVLAFSAYRMLASSDTSTEDEHRPNGAEQRKSRLRFRNAYLENSTGRVVRYRVGRVPLGVAISTLAGLISGLLGVGGGIIQVPVMNLIMHVPIKVATTTSTYVIGITAMAGAFVYYNHKPSFVDPALAVPVTIGVFLGATFGSRLLSRLRPTVVRNVFTAVMLIYALQMVARTVGFGA
jgi:uncharacterized protein